MADDQKTASSATKTPEQTTAQTQSKSTSEAEAKAGAVELSHGESTKAAKADQEAAEKTAHDPYGDTPAQMRAENQDPDLEDALAGGATRVTPLEPGQTPGDDAPKGGTNAPA